MQAPLQERHLEDCLTNQMIRYRTAMRQPDFQQKVKSFQDALRLRVSAQWEEVKQLYIQSCWSDILCSDNGVFEKFRQHGFTNETSFQAPYDETIRIADLVLVDLQQEPPGRVRPLSDKIRIRMKTVDATTVGNLFLNFALKKALGHLRILRTENEKLQNRIDNARAELSRQQMIYAPLRGQVELLTEQLQELRVRSNERAAEINRLRALIQEENRAHAELIAPLNEEIQNLRGQIEEQEAIQEGLLAQKDREIAGLRQRCEALDLANTQREERIAELRKRVNRPVREENLPGWKSNLNCIRNLIRSTPLDGGLQGVAFVSGSAVVGLVAGAPVTLPGFAAAAAISFGTGVALSSVGLLFGCERKPHPTNNDRITNSRI